MIAIARLGGTKVVNKDFIPYTRGGTWPPAPPGGRMPLEQRAKIFMPFDPLPGFTAALHKKEAELEAKHPDMHPLGEHPH